MHRLIIRAGFACRPSESLKHSICETLTPLTWKEASRDLWRVPPAPREGSANPHQGCSCTFQSPSTAMSRSACTLQELSRDFWWGICMFSCALYCLQTQRRGFDLTDGYFGESCSSQDRGSNGLFKIMSQLRFFQN